MAELPSPEQIAQMEGAELDALAVRAMGWVLEDGAFYIPRRIDPRYGDERTIVHWSPRRCADDAIELAEKVFDTGYEVLLRQKPPTPDLKYKVSLWPRVRGATDHLYAYAPTFALALTRASVIAYFAQKLAKERQR